MIHYHGTPIGGSRQDCARFLVGRHALIPFGREEDLGAVLENCQSFVIDNGAFSHWRKGRGQIDVEAYLRFVTSLYRHPGFDWCLIPDIIDGDESDNKRLAIEFVRDAPRKLVSVPVWHLHESLDYLEWMVDEFQIIAMGSSGVWRTPGTDSWWKRIDEAMRVICDSDGTPKCKLHGLRMLSTEIFTKMPLASADSTNAAVNSGSLHRFGMYKPATSSQRAAVIADRIEMHNSASIYVFSDQQQDIDFLFG